MVKRTAEDDAVAFLVNWSSFRETLSNDALCRDLLHVGLYRLARYEGDH